MSENETNVSQLSREKYERVAAARKRLTDILDVEFPGGYALVISHYSDPDKCEGSWNMRFPGFTDVSGAPSAIAITRAESMVQGLVEHATNLQDGVLKRVVHGYQEQEVLNAALRNAARTRWDLLERQNQQLLDLRKEVMALQGGVEALEKKARKKPRKAGPKKKRGRKK